MGLETIGMAMSIGSGVMGIAQGFAQSGTQSAQAAAQERAAQNTYYAKQAAMVRFEGEQAQQETAATSTRVAEAQRNLGTLAAVMGERGVAGQTFTGLLNDLSNSESIDVGRIKINYGNQIASDEAQLTGAGQDYVNAVQDAEFRKSAAGTSAWLNAIGTTIKVGGGYVSHQLDMQATQDRYDALLLKASKGGALNPYSGS
jgi:hypothetical protein